jgi:hypothetical protein
MREQNLTGRTQAPQHPAPFLKYLLFGAAGNAVLHGG